MTPLEMAGAAAAALAEPGTLGVTLTIPKGGMPAQPGRAVPALPPEPRQAAAPAKRQCDEARARKNTGAAAMNDQIEQSVTDVLPCPFCGSTEGFYVGEGTTLRWRLIACRNCGEGTEVRHKNDSYAAEIYIADWNAAAPYPAMLRKEIDNLLARLAEAQRDTERWRRAAQCARLDQFGGFVITPDEPAFASDVSLAFAREIDVAIDAAKGKTS